MTQKQINALLKCLPEGASITINRNKRAIFGKRVWAVIAGSVGNTYGPFWGDTPVEAIRNAGVLPWFTCKASKTPEAKP